MRTNISLNSVGWERRALCTFLLHYKRAGKCCGVAARVVWEEATPRRLVAAGHMDTILCMVTAEALE